MVKYAPRKVYIRESGGYVELSYTEFCRCRESDQTYMDKLFIQRGLPNTTSVLGTRPIWTSCLSPFKAVCLKS